MRTTLTIDDDVLRAVKERARQLNQSIGSVLSDLARQALTSRSASTAKRPPAFHGFQPLPHRGDPVTNTLIDQLREEDTE